MAILISFDAYLTNATETQYEINLDYEFIIKCLNMEFDTVVFLWLHRFYKNAKTSLTKSI